MCLRFLFHSWGLYTATDHKHDIYICILRVCDHYLLNSWPQYVTVAEAIALVKDKEFVVPAVVDL